ncbi:MAG: SLBB domain-containing protein [Pyrinomonadaceae bacterium]|nr:SLBB domain-containing protein [Pyrinomonadaceae bacterium]MCX7640690.1 SLBB domain-containing protein [Pyrinomonadaceae bacterium]MDW8305394.1 SLBB domain-containing protein [Acidobacteriota bacterium]
MRFRRSLPALKRLLFFLTLILLLGHVKLNGQTDKVHFGDVIEVKLIGFPEYDWTGSLNPDGFLDSLELIEEPVYALCKTEKELAELIEKVYSKYIREPKVKVKIIDTSKRPAVVIYGAVRKPMRLIIKRPVNLSEVIAFADGLTEKASGEISIFRSKSSSCLLEMSSDSTQIKISIPDLLSAKEESNPLILSGDIIEVTEALPVYVLGAVAKVGSIPFRMNMKLSQAIAAAGGVTKKATGEVLIFRKESGETKVIEAKLDSSISLKAHDIIEVREKGKPKVMIQPIEPEERPNFSELPLKIIN